MREGAALKLISLILQGVGYFLHYFFCFYDHIFSLSLFLSLSSPSCCLFLLVEGSCFTAECCLVFQMSTHGSLPGWRSYPQPQQHSKGPYGALIRWNSQGPNVNTACDTPSQHAFKPSDRGSSHLSVAVQAARHLVGI